MTLADSKNLKPFAPKSSYGIIEASAYVFFATYKEYVALPGARNYVDSKQWCLQNGGFIATILTEEENKLMKQTLKAMESAFSFKSITTWLCWLRSAFKRIQ